MSRLPRHPSERRTLLRRAGLLSLFAAGLVLGMYGGKRACAAERLAALRAQADADAVVNQNHQMAELTERAAAMVWARDSTIHRLPACRPRGAGGG